MHNDTIIEKTVQIVCATMNPIAPQAMKDDYCQDRFELVTRYIDTIYNKLVELDKKTK